MKSTLSSVLAVSVVLTTGCSSTFSAYTKAAQANKNSAATGTTAGKIEGTAASSSGQSSDAKPGAHEISKSGPAPAILGSTASATGSPAASLKIFSDWPNVIECRGGPHRQYFYLSHFRENSAVAYVNPYNHNGQGAGAYGIIFNSNKTYQSTLGGSTESMSDCIGKSIADLEKLGRAHSTNRGEHIYADWPNVIQCGGMGSLKQFFYLSHFGENTGITYVDPLTHNGKSAGAYGIVFNGDKSFRSTLGGSVESMNDCLGSSIQDLEKQGKGHSVAKGESVFADWPNVIECRGSGTYRQYFYLSHIQGDSTVGYRDPYNHNAVSAGAYGLIFNSDKSFKSTAGGSEESMSDCVGKSIQNLRDAGRAH